MLEALRKANKTREKLPTDDIRSLDVGPAYAALHNGSNRLSSYQRRHSRVRHGVSSFIPNQFPQEIYPPPSQKSDLLRAMAATFRLRNNRTWQVTSQDHLSSFIAPSVPSASFKATDVSRSFQLFPISSLAIINAHCKLDQFIRSRAEFCKPDG